MAYKEIAFSDEVDLKLGLSGGTLTGGIEIDRSSDPFVRVTDGTKIMYAGYITSTSGMLGTTTNHPLEIRTNNTARLTFANSGEATFSGSLSVDGVGSLEEVGTGQFLLKATGSGKYVQIQSNEGIYFTTGGLNHNYITSSGVFTSSQGASFSGTSSYGALKIIPTASYVSIIQHDSGSGALDLRSDQINLKSRDGSEIGLSYNSGGTLIVNSNTTFSGVQLNHITSTDAQMLVKSTSASHNASINIDSAGTRDSLLGFYSATTYKWLLYNKANDSHKFKIQAGDGSTPFILEQNGTATFSGAVAVNTSALVAMQIRNTDTTDGYGLAVESQGTSNTRYNVIFRNNDASVVYGGIATKTGQVGHWGVGYSPGGTLANRLCVNGAVSIGTNSTTAPTNGLLTTGNVITGKQIDILGALTEDSTLRLITDNAGIGEDYWRIRHANSDHKIYFEDYSSGSYVSRFSLGQDGTATFSGDITGPSGWTLNWLNANTRIRGSNSNEFIQFDVGGVAEVFKVTPTSATFSGNLSLPDGKYVFIGTNDDLQLTHSGTHGNIINHTGNLYLKQNSSGSSILFHTRFGGGALASVFEVTDAGIMASLGTSYLHGAGKISLANKTANSNWTGFDIQHNSSNGLDIIKKSYSGSGDVTAININSAGAVTFATSPTFTDIQSKHTAQYSTTATLSTTAGVGTIDVAQVSQTGTTLDFKTDGTQRLVLNSTEVYAHRDFKVADGKVIGSKGTLYLDSATNCGIQLRPQGTSKIEVGGDGRMYWNGRLRINTDGQLHWGSAYQQGYLSWDTNEAIIGSLASNSLRIQSGGATSLVMDTSQNSRFYGDVAIGGANISGIKIRGQQDSDTDVDIANATFNNVLSIYNATNNGANNNTTMHFGGEPNAEAYISLITKSNYGDLVFSVRGSSGRAEALRLSDSSATFSGIMYNTRGTHTNALYGSGASWILESGGTSNIILNSSANVKINIGSVTKFYIDSNGHAIFAGNHYYADGFDTYVNSVHATETWLSSGTPRHQHKGDLIVNGTTSLTGDVTLSSALTVGNNLYMQGVIARSGNNNLDFYTNSALRLRMTGAGNIGIGTTTPTSYYEKTLHLHESAGSFAIKMSNNTTGATNDDATDLIAYQDDFYIWNRETNGLLVFGTNATQQLSISSTTATFSGNVAVGNVSPSDYDAGGDNLVVYDSGNSGISIIAGTAGTSAIHFGDGTGAGSYRGYINYSHGNDAFTFATGASARMTINSSGNIGIGTAPNSFHADQTYLQIGGTGSIFSQTAVGASKSMYIGQNVQYDADGTWDVITEDESSLYEQNGGRHYFYTAPSHATVSTLTARMVIDVGGTTTFGGKITSSGVTATHELLLLKAGANNHYPYMRITRDNGSYHWDMGMSSDSLSALFFKNASGSNALKLDTDLSATFGGNATFSGKTIVGTHNSNAHGLYIESTHSTNKFGYITAGSVDNNVSVGLKLSARDSNGGIYNQLTVESDGISTLGNATFGGGITAETGIFNDNVIIASTKVLYLNNIRHQGSYAMTIGDGNNPVTISSSYSSFTSDVNIAGDNIVTKAGGGILKLRTTDTELQANDVIGTIEFSSDDATTSGVDVGAKIVATATSNYQSAGSNVDAPTRLDFFTQDDTTTDVMSTVGATLSLGGNDQSAIFRGKTHIRPASSSATAHTEADNLIIEDSATPGMSILFPSASKGTLAFGHPSDNDAYSIVADSNNGRMSISAKHASDIMRFNVGGSRNLELSGASGSEKNSFTGQVIIDGASRPAKLSIQGHTNTSNLGDNVDVSIFGGNNTNVLTQLGIGYSGATVYPNAILATTVTDSSGHVKQDFLIALRETTSGSTRPVEKFRIKADGTTSIVGSLGIGTSTPSSYSDHANQLVVAGSSNAGMTIVSGTSSGSKIHFADGTSGDQSYRGYINYTHSDGSASDYFTIGTAGSSRIYIDSNGHITPSSNNAVRLGSNSLKFEHGYFSNTVYSGTFQGGNFAGGTITLTGGATFDGDVTLNSTNSLKIPSGSSVASLPFAFKDDLDVGLWNPSNNALGFVTAGVERLNISDVGTATFSGKVGVGNNGTNASSWNLCVKGDSGGTIDANGGAGYFAIGDDYSTSGSILMVRNDGNRGSKGHASGSSLFKASFNDATAFEIDKDGLATFGGDVTMSAPSSGGSTFEIRTNDGEESKLIFADNTGGDFWIFNHDRDNAGTSDDSLSISSKTTSNVMNMLQNGKVYFAGNVYSNSVLLTSDKKFKDDVKDIPNALETTSKLRGVSYIDNRDKISKLGVIAQEVEPIVPEVVSTESHTKYVDYVQLVPMLIESIKELKHEVETLKAKIGD